MKWIGRLIGLIVLIVVVAGVSLFFLPADGSHASPLTRSVMPPGAM